MNEAACTNNNILQSWQ